MINFAPPPWVGVVATQHTFIMIHGGRDRGWLAAAVADHRRPKLRVRPLGEHGREQEHSAHLHHHHQLRLARSVRRKKKKHSHGPF